MLKKRPSEYSDGDYGSSTFKTTRTYYDKLSNILEKTGKLELVSASSLTGFIFKITTNESKSYIMKIVVLAPNDTDKRITLTNCAQSVNSLKYRTKLTETEDDFRYESQIQEYIYKNSKTGSRSPLCPKVEYAVIYKNDISKLFLTLLSDIGNSNSSTEIKSAIACLLYYFNNEFYNENGPYFFRLGIILMNEIPNSVTFYEFTHNNNNSENDIAYSYIYYQLIYLFLIIGVINFDMHMDNALVYSDNGTIKTTLIDFGKGDNLKYLNNNRYLSYEEKEYINEIRGRLKTELFNIIFSVEDQRQLKINFIMKTMNIINIICWIVNRKNFVYSDENPHRHQMNWFRPIDIVKTFMTDNIKNINAVNMSSIITDVLSIDYIPDSQIPIISFDILKKNTITISTKNMNPKYTLIKEFDLDNMPPINNSCKKNDGYDDGENGENRMCLIMGGKKTRKTKRKYNTKFYIKSGKKSKIKPKRKSQITPQKKSSRKTKRTHAK